ncbi:SAF domain-containing protein [Microbacterium excoecariae]|uniref:SAF domain-containing protein n=1 Tax=Microbacterium excoecariae TaxID=2715210 RepID=UPI00140B1BB9|nr:SAF domain-containing protein [Microbacterium excoecariae]NHI17425.1 hypothetical protein [Microbacterium excoecariae]
MAATVSRRRRRLDPRLFVGIVLVLGSVAGVWAIVDGARHTEPVLVAREALVPGQAVTAGDVEAVDVQLATSQGAYLTPDDLADGVVAVRTIAAGELVPAAAVGAAGTAGTTTVVVRSALEAPAGVVPGTPVELWAAPLVAPGSYGEPIVVVERAVVAAVLEDDGVVADPGSRLELVIARDEVAEVLGHTAGGSALSAVPTAGGAG